MTDENKHPEVKNIHDELKEMEKEKNIIEENIQNLENLHINLKNKLINQEKKIDEQEHKIKLEQIKLKNQHQIDVLLEKNKKLEKYLEILSKKYELEIKHIEQYCDHKSRIYKSGQITKESIDGVSKVIEEITRNIENTILNYNDLSIVEEFSKSDKSLRESLAKVRNYSILPKYIIEGIGICAFSILLNIIQLHCIYKNFKFEIKFEKK